MRMGKKRTLGRRSVQVLKGVHIASVSLVTGGLFSMLSLLLVKHFASLHGNVFPIDLGVFQIFNSLVTYAYFGIIVTSVIYALFTPVGFFRHYWVMVKWILLLVVFLMTWFRLGPAVSAMTSLSDSGFHLTVSAEDYRLFTGRALVYTAMEIAILFLILFISTIKPWGTVRVEARMNRTLLLTLVGVIALGIVFMSVSSAVRLHHYRTMPIGDTNLSSLADGTYRGEAYVGSYLYKVDVTVEGKRITDIKAIDNRESPYAFFAEGVFGKIIRDQNANTDAVTGATTTSKALMKAVEHALTSGK